MITLNLLPKIQRDFHGMGQSPCGCIPVGLEDKDERSAMNISATKAPVVIIVGPPLPRTGAGRVMQNQVEFYRSRGYEIVFVCVPIHCSFVETHPDWQKIREGIQELGADRTFFAPVDDRRFRIAKYVTWLERGFRGTALDWIVFTGKSARLPDDVIRSIRQLPIALMHVNHVYTLGFAERLLRQVRPDHPVPMILETHDVLANSLQERGEINPWTHRYDTVDALLRSELSYLSKTEVLVHCSVDDFDFFRLRLPDKRHILVMPTIDEAFISAVGAADQCSSDSFDLLFVGYSTDPNRAAMKWFFEEVWPLISDRGYSIQIVGQIDSFVREFLPEIYQTYRSYFVGPTAELASIYRAARCVLAPMVSGTGISIKTVEALALGKPFVGTSRAYRGMPMDLILQAGLQAHDSPQDFADAIVRALSQEQLAAAASRRAYIKVFSKEGAFASRDQALRLATVS